MNTNWFFKIEERESHGKSEGQWIISGWYKDEKQSYKKAEVAWEAQRTEGYAQHIKSRADYDPNDLNMIDDYFHWRVTSPYWNLHSDGEWRRGLAKNNEQYRHMSGHFSSRDACEVALGSYGEPPTRFPDYEGHVQSTGTPYSPQC